MRFFWILKTHMGQIAQDGENEQNVSYFFCFVVALLCFGQYLLESAGDSKSNDDDDDFA